MTRAFIYTKDSKHEFDSLPFPIGIDFRSGDILFADDICRICGYHSEKHRLVFSNELTSEWKICATEHIHYDPTHPSPVTETRYICIPKKGQEEYMTREEFEELYNDE